jgi:hypothetical protein
LTSWVWLSACQEKNSFLDFMLCGPCRLMSNVWNCKYSVNVLPLLFGRLLNTSLLLCCRWCCRNVLWRWPSSGHDAPPRAMHTSMAVALDASWLV